MNGHILLADACRQMVRKGEMDRETAEKQIRVYEFLASCDLDDKCLMVDSSAFNDIIEAYLIRVATEAGIGDEARQRMLEQLNRLFDGSAAKEILLDR